MLSGHVRTRIAATRLAIDVQEVVQMTFAQAWSQIESFDYRGEGSLRRWLVTLAGNLLNNEIDRILSSRTQRADTGVLENQEDAQQAQREAQRAERLSIDEAIAQLPPDEAEILLMYKDEGLNLNQIAEILECAHATAAKRLSRAMGNLRRLLGERPEP